MVDEREALRLIAADLPIVNEDRQPARAKGRLGDYLVNTGRAPEKDEIVALFSSVQRIGNWTAPHKLDAVALFGSSHIDLRNALIPREGMHIDAVGVFGNASVQIKRR